LLQLSTPAVRPLPGRRAAVAHLEPRRQGVAMARRGYEVAARAVRGGPDETVARGEDVGHRNGSDSMDEMDAAEHDGDRAVAHRRLQVRGQAPVLRAPRVWADRRLDAGRRARPRRVREGTIARGR